MKGLTYLSSLSCITIWQQTLSLVEQEMIRPSFDTWIKVLSPLSFENGVFEIGTHRQIVKEWVETRYLSMIRKAMETVLNQPVLITLSIIPPDATQAQENPTPPIVPASQTSVFSKQTVVSSSPIRIDENPSPLNP